MYETDQQRLDAIARTARTMDINSQESELLAQEEVDWMAGDVDETPADDANVPDSMPLESAIDTQRVSKSPVFQNIFQALKELHADFVNKSKDAKAAQDARTLNHQMGMGLEAALGIFTTLLEESEARLKAATPAERRAMGSEANQFIAELIQPAATAQEPVVQSRPAAPPSAGVQSNTKRAQEWLKQSDAKKRN